MHEKAVFRHMFECNHALDWTNANFLYQSSCEKQRLVVEAALIQHIPNFNLTLGASCVNKSTKELILNQNKNILSKLPQITIDAIV